MTRRFCDICDKPLTPEDDTPFVRFHADKDVQIMLAVTNSVGGILNDVCNSCKESIVTNGLTEPPKREFATLQIEPSAPGPMMEVRPKGGAGSPYTRSESQPATPQEKGEGEPA